MAIQKGQNVVVLNMREGIVGNGRGNVLIVKW